MSNVPDHIFNVLEKVSTQAYLLEQEIKRLREILSEARLPIDYLKALSWQNARASFHADQAFVAAQADTQPAEDVEVAGTVWKEPAVIAIAETIACVHAMHAMGDTIWEMIRALFFSDEEKKIILKELESNEQFHELYMNPHKSYQTGRTLPLYCLRMHQ